MIRTVLKKIFLGIPAEHSRSFREDLSSDNLTRLLIGGATLSAVELGVFISFMNMGLGIYKYPLVVIIYNAVMIPVLIMLRRRSVNRRLKQAVVYCSISFYIVWSCLFTWSTRSSSLMSAPVLPLSVYMLMIYGIAVFFFLEPAVSAGFFILSLVLFMALIPFPGFSQRETLSVLWNVIALNLFAWIASRLIFGFRLRSFLDNAMIQNKNIELEAERNNLKDALARVKHLTGLLPICANCKKVRDDSGYWQQVEKYVSERTEATFSHSLCPECVKKLYPDIDDSGK